MSSFREVSSSHLHSILSHLDPEAASVLHPGEKRKIIRALQVMQRNDGTKYSAILEEQRSREGGSNHSGPLRFKNAIIFWAHTQEEILNKRLDDRVDVMLNNGLVQELLEFHEKYRKSRIERGFKTDYSEGIFQAIGLRDFHQYLILPESQRGLSNKRILEDCVYEMKIQTRKYAKRQVKNFRSRLLEAHGRQVPPIFLLDTSHPEQWNEAVRDKAFRILDFIMTQQNLPNDLQPLKWESKPIDRRTIKRCDICDKVVSGEEQWAAHIQSKGHKALYKIKKQSKESGSVSSVSKEVYSKEEMVKNLES
jgi:tRNA dimethylallyltransferase